VTSREVQAVFFWRYGKAAFAAAYGRISGSTKYSKDFLQSPAAQYPIIDKALGRTGNASVPVRHVWPGGERTGEWRMSAAEGDFRGQLSWLPMSESPLPWRVGDPAADVAVTIPGSPHIATDAGADAEFDLLSAKGLKPWIVSVRLRDDGANLHARAYLEHPPAGQEGRSVDTLPKRVRDAIKALPGNVGGGAIDFDTLPPPVIRAKELVRRVIDSLSRDPNVLLIGPPGTGKTVALEDLRADFLSQAGRVFFDPDAWDYAWQDIGVGDRRALTVVFHPSYGYEDFVAGLLPSMDAGGFRLTARPGPLVSLAHWATGAPQRRALLIIDEFNRGPTAAIFGDTLALLDADKRLDRPGGWGAKIIRPYPRESMDVEPAYANSGGETAVSTEFGLPASLSIVAALNSSDRSVTPLDAALRRRFAIIPVPPDYNSLARHFAVAEVGQNETFAPADPNPANWSQEEVKRLLVLMLQSLNVKISLVLGTDFQLGHALLWPVNGATVEALTRSAAHAFDDRIGAALRLTFADQDEALAAILRAGDPGTIPTLTQTRLGISRWHLPPDDMQAVSNPRLEIVSQAPRPFGEVLAAFRGLL
jgi:5-methylcytosine-specific restriction protein B